jgi:hypothetical protein
VASIMKVLYERPSVGKNDSSPLEKIYSTNNL